MVKLLLDEGAVDDGSIRSWWKMTVGVMEPWWEPDDLEDDGVR
jgi:hypothetical protein